MPHQKIMLLLTAFLVLMLNSFVAGEPDSTFGEDGYTITDVGSDNERVSKVIVDSQGRIIVVGPSIGPLGFMIVRYTPDGVLDSTFNGDGILLERLGLQQPIGLGANDVAIDAQGKIVVVGIAQSDAVGYSAGFIARYNDDGTRDMTFNGSGSVLVENYFEASAVGIDSANRVVVAAIPQNFGEATVWRYNADGSVDPTFTSTIVNDLYPTDLAVSGDDRVVVVGWVFLEGSTDRRAFGIVRFKSDGSLDETFASDGFEVISLGQDYESFSDVEIDAESKIVAVGATSSALTQEGGNYEQANFAVIRFTSDGALDGTFGNEGKVETDFGTRADYANNVFLLPDNKLMVVGWSFADSRYRSVLAIARYRNDGTLDSTFGIAGKLLDIPVSSKAGISSFALDTNQRLIMAGAITTAEKWDVFTARYLLTTGTQTELLLDGSFETVDTTWKETNLTQDKLRCDQTENELKSVAFTGLCARKFIGSNGENSSLKQKIEGSSLKAGNSLLLSAWGSSNDSSTEITVKINYSDDTKDSFSLLLNPVNKGYQKFAAPAFVLPKDVQRVVVKVRYRSETGKFWLDDVSLTVTQGESALGLPEVSQ